MATAYDTFKLLSSNPKFIDELKNLMSNTDKKKINKSLTEGVDGDEVVWEVEIWEIDDELKPVKKVDTVTVSFSELPKFYQDRATTKELIDATDGGKLSFLGGKVDSIANEKFHNSILFDGNKFYHAENRKVVKNELPSRANELGKVVGKRLGMSKYPIKENKDQEEETGVCEWCGDETPIYELHNTDYGHICDYCIQEIKSRGERVHILESKERVLSGKPIEIPTGAKPIYTDMRMGTPMNFYKIDGVIYDALGFKVKEDELKELGLTEGAEGKKSELVEELDPLYNERELLKSFDWYNRLKRTNHDTTDAAQEIRGICRLLRLSKPEYRSKTTNAELIDYIQNNVVQERHGSTRYCDDEIEESLTEALSPELQEMKSRWEEIVADGRLNVLEFPADYKYIDIDWNNGTIFAGSATNTGVMREFEMPLDTGENLDENIAELYDLIITQRPELLDPNFIDEEEAECEWCGDSFPISELRETDKGHLCDYCIQAIKSHGEPITLYEAIDKKSVEITGDEDFTVKDVDVEHTGGGIWVAYGVYDNGIGFALGSDLLFLYDEDGRKEWDAEDEYEWENAHILWDDYGNGLNSTTRLFKSTLKQVFDKECERINKTAEEAVAVLDYYDLFRDNKDILVSNLNESADELNIDKFIKIDNKELRDKANKLFNAGVITRNQLIFNITEDDINKLYKQWFKDNGKLRYKPKKLKESVEGLDDLLKLNLKPMELFAKAYDNFGISSTSGDESEWLRLFKYANDYFNVNPVKLDDTSRLEFLDYDEDEVEIEDAEEVLPSEFNSAYGVIEDPFEDCSIYVSDTEIPNVVYIVSNHGDGFITKDNLKKYFNDENSFNYEVQELAKDFERDGVFKNIDKPLEETMSDEEIIVGKLNNGNEIVVRYETTGYKVIVREPDGFENAWREFINSRNETRDILFNTSEEAVEFAKEKYGNRLKTESINEATNIKYPKLNSSTRDMVEIGDALTDSPNGEPKWVVSERWDAEPPIKSTTITCVSVGDWRTVYGLPISKWYGTYIIKGPFIRDRENNKLIKEN